MQQITMTEHEAKFLLTYIQDLQKVLSGVPYLDDVRGKIVLQIMKQNEVHEGKKIK